MNHKHYTKRINEAGEKQCKNCYKFKPLSEFYIKQVNKNGTICHQPNCKGACHNEVINGWAKTRRQNRIKQRWNQIMASAQL